MMRKISFRVGVFLMCMLLVLSPSVALGEDRELDGGVGVGWAGEVEGGNYAVHARALNKYNAACWAMGVNPLTISTANRSKLSDPNYGGDFYVYAQSFTNIIGWDDVPGWMPTYATLTFVLYGFDNQWASEVSKSLYDSAKVDFKHVLAGEDVGGGGGGNVSNYSEVVLNSSNVVLKKGTPPKYVCQRATIGSDGSVTIGSGTATYSDAPASPYYVSTARFYVSPLWQSLANGYIAQGKKVIVGASPRASNPAAFFFIVCDSYSVSRHVNPGDSNSTKDFLVLVNGYVYISRGNAFYADGIGPFFVVLSADDPSSLPPASGEVSPDYWAELSSTAAPPAGTWPEPEPTPTPTAPEVPTPTAPTVTPDPEPTQPTPTWPDITINIPSAPTVEVTPTGLDYTELLTRINDNLNTINSYTVSINSGLNSLRSDLVTEFESVEQGLRNIYQFLQHMDSMLERHCQHLRDALSDCTHHLELYMKELFEWLPQQLNYDAHFDYDDSAVTSLLRRILNKMPGGSSGNPNTYKPNPQADEPGFFDWLTDLWHRFLIDLVSVLPDELGGLVDAFSQLTHYFPFSIPWDLFALLLLFEHEPVTPVFQIPWGYGGGDSQTQMITIDLSVWDGVMAMVRPVFLVGFCFKLALITKDLLAGFDLNKGGV